MTLAFLIAWSARVQPLNSAAALVQFDAASIKVDNSPGIIAQSQGGPGSSDPGRITFGRTPLWVFIKVAYGIEPDQIFGKLSDVQNDKFTLVATIPSGATVEQFHLMLQNLLADRFHLVVHHESREFPGYKLVVAEGGPKCKEWDHDPNSPPIARSAAGEPGYVYTLARYLAVHVINRQSMADFAGHLGDLLLMSEAISNSLDGKVPLDQRLLPMRGQSLPVAPTPRIVDDTGLKGIYQFTLDFEGTYMAGYIPSAGGPNLFVALEKQLGLKLVKVKGVPVDVIVIDRVDRIPVEN